MALTNSASHTIRIARNRREVSSPENLEIYRLMTSTQSYSVQWRAFNFAIMNMLTFRSLRLYPTAQRGSRRSSYHSTVPFFASHHPVKVYEDIKIVVADSSMISSPSYWSDIFESNTPVLIKGRSWSSHQFRAIITRYSFTAVSC